MNKYRRKISPELTDTLITNEADIYGTLRIARKKVPNNLKQNKLKKWEFTVFQRDKVMVMRWHNKVITPLSMTYNSKYVDVKKKGGKDIMEVKNYC